MRGPTIGEGGLDTCASFARADFRERELGERLEVGDDIGDTGNDGSEVEPRRHCYGVCASEVVCR